MRKWIGLMMLGALATGCAANPIAAPTARHAVVVARQQNVKVANRLQNTAKMVREAAAARRQAGQITDRTVTAAEEGF
jgi:hypothetical protein